MTPIILTKTILGTACGTVVVDAEKIICCEKSVGHTVVYLEVHASKPFSVDVVETPTEIALEINRQNIQLFTDPYNCDRTGGTVTLRKIPAGDGHDYR